MFQNSTSPHHPVMVWIHGGGFQMGSGNGETFLYGPKIFMDRDIVLVTINYRLGPLGAWVNSCFTGNEFLFSNQCWMVRFLHNWLGRSAGKLRTTGSNDGFEMDSGANSPLWRRSEIRHHLRRKRRWGQRWSPHPVTSVQRQLLIAHINPYLRSTCFCNRFVPQSYCPVRDQLMQLGHATCGDQTFVRADQETGLSW